MASKVAELSLLFDWPCWPDHHAVPSHTLILITEFVLDPLDEVSNQCLRSLLIYLL
jgi:hypothetical protein